MKTLTVAHLAPHLKVHVALFEGLKNARFLRKQLLEGNTDFEYAFIDAKTVRQIVNPNQQWGRKLTIRRTGPRRSTSPCCRLSSS
jgi:hypothetical protein